MSTASIFSSYLSILWQKWNPPLSQYSPPSCLRAFVSSWQKEKAARRAAATSPCFVPSSLRVFVSKKQGCPKGGRNITFFVPSRLRVFVAIKQGCPNGSRNFSLVPSIQRRLPEGRPPTINHKIFVSLTLKSGNPRRQRGNT